MGTVLLSFYPWNIAQCLAPSSYSITFFERISKCMLACWLASFKYNTTKMVGKSLWSPRGNQRSSFCLASQVSFLLLLWTALKLNIWIKIKYFPDKGRLSDTESYQRRHRKMITSVWEKEAEIGGISEEINIWKTKEGSRQMTACAEAWKRWHI